MEKPGESRAFSLWASASFVVLSTSSSSSGDGRYFVIATNATTSSSGESLQLRHPGESRDPAPCLWLLVRFAKPDSRPCALRRASLRAGHFLLLAQEKVTKEKGTPGTAVAGSSRRLREDAAAVR
jgi:hypothetical protein